MKKTILRIGIAALLAACAVGTSAADGYALTAPPRDTGAAGSCDPEDDEPIRKPGQPPKRHADRVLEARL
jgi:hypothetical protein